MRDLVVAEPLAQLHHLRLQLLHLAHRPVGLVGEREEAAALTQQGQQQDGDAEIADDAVDEVQDVEDRLGQEVEPAEVDRAVEQRDAVAGRGSRRAASTSLAPANSRSVTSTVWPGATVIGVAAIVDLIAVCPRRWWRKRALSGRSCCGTSDASQYLSVMPEPAAGALEVDRGRPRRRPCTCTPARCPSRTPIGPSCRM